MFYMSMTGERERKRERDYVMVLSLMTLKTD